jgi:hypothetical protein
MIKTDLIAYLEKMYDAELWFEYENYLTQSLDDYQKVASHITTVMINSVDSQVAIVEYEQTMNSLLNTFRNTMNYLLHITLVMNKRIAQQRAEMDNQL